MDEWKCIKINRVNQAWTLGKIYRTDREGRLVDDDGDARLSPHIYNDLGYTNFELVLSSIENE